MAKRRRLPTKTIVELYEAGATIEELASKYRAAYLTIRRRLNEAGVEIRGRGRDADGLGVALARIAVTLEELGGVEKVFAWAHVRRRFGAPATNSSMVLEFYGKNRDGRISVERIGHGRYRLLPEWQEKAQAWIDSGGAMRFRAAEAQRLQEQIEADLAQVEAGAGPSPWRAVQRQFRDRRKLRRSQNGRVLLALQAAGRPLSTEEVRTAAAGKGGWSRASRLRAIQRGLIVYDPLRKVYDLPARAAPLSIARTHQEFILLTLASAGPMSMAAIAGALGEKRRRVKDGPMKRLRAAGEVDRTGPGRYEITDVGMDRVREIVARKVGDDG